MAFYVKKGVTGSQKTTHDTGKQNDIKFDTGFSLWSLQRALV